MIAISKSVGGYEVYQTDNTVSIGLGQGCGSVFGSRTYSNTATAAHAYKRLNTTTQVLTFARDNPVD